MNDQHIQGPSRRRLLTGASALGASALLTAGLAGCSDDVQAGGEGASDAEPTNLQDLKTADEIWAAMLAGNERWSKGEALHPNTTIKAREDHIEDQAPPAAVISCVDSRIAPELAFDTGVGDLMVTRTAGNVLDPLVSESVSYGPAALETPLLVVLGHQNCGAVKAAHAALKAEEEGHEPEDHGIDLSETVAALRDAYNESQGESGDPILAMIETNVAMTVRALSEHPNMAHLVEDGQLIIKGAYYSFDTGLVTEVS